MVPTESAPSQKEASEKSTGIQGPSPLWGLGFRDPSSIVVLSLFFWLKTFLQVFGGWSGLLCFLASTI